MKISEEKLRRVAEEVLANVIDEDDFEDVVEELIQRAADEAEEA